VTKIRWNDEDVQQCIDREQAIGEWMGMPRLELRVKLSASDLPLVGIKI